VDYYRPRQGNSQFLVSKTAILVAKTSFQGDQSASDRVPLRRNGVIWRYVMIRIALLIANSLILVGCASKPIAKNHIIFVVDGMGHAHITGARMYKGGPEARLELEKMPYTGIVRTYSTDDFATDSAASATALASGTRTYNGAIGVSDAKKDSTGQSQPLLTILKRAQQAGKAVGLVTTTRITHATPAAYYAHAAHRDLEESIAGQLVASDIDVIIGGGKRFFVGRGEGGSRQDGKNLLNEFTQKGYRVVKTSEEFKSLPVKPEGRLIALLEEDHLPYDLDRRDQPSIEELVDYAIRHLSQDPDGYFLLVEAGRVDHASHANLARHTFGEMLAFDRALGRTLSESERDTLILVTGDHETGGLALNGYAPHEVASGERLLQNHSRDPKSPAKKQGLISWASGPGFTSPSAVNDKDKNFKHKAAYDAPSAYHTAVDVPVIARGPGAEKFTGFINNNDLVHKVIEIMKLEPIRR